MGVADHVDPVGRQPAGELGVERGRERVAGDQQRAELLLRRRLGTDRGRVEGVGGDRREPAFGARDSEGACEAAGDELGVGGEAAGELVLGGLQRQPVGDPLGRPADRVDDVAADAGIDLGRGVADRAAGEQHQQQSDQGDRADGVASAE